ncbi:MAG TPA: peptidoglycan recognition family protein [Vicinamibacteria bacterium]|nr:peptidoglycan recognition family protein [Vicinamibacteria bacterium]
MSAIEEQSRTIRDPVAKLRYIRGSLARCQETDRRLQSIPTPLRRLFDRVTRFDRVRPLLSTNPNGRAVEPGKAEPPPPRARLGLPAAVALAGGALLAAAYQTSRPVAAEAPVAAAASASVPVAETLPTLPIGVAPSRIWMVDRGEGWELYSNGLRVDTTYAVRGDPRRYRVFDARAGMREASHERPAGILYHTSESDIWPLEESFNERLRDSSQGLLRYLRRNRVYNYLIDRFGQVFRVVEEAEKANHAGHSVWTRGDEVYLNLNNAFLGVSFETRWEGGRALPITQAQLGAGRNLTDHLRQRWDIPAEMCVTHGLTSVNVQKHLIGHHLDWARGFPFEAFGLPDQYGKAAPTVALFGFGYDERLLSVMGKPWPGVQEAERMLAEEAAGLGKTVAELRKERRARFDAWLAQQAKDQAEGQRGGGARSAGAGTRAAGPGRIGG